MNEIKGFDVRVPLPFDAALARTREALKAEGFGILTEIDLAAAFLEKLGEKFRPYVILGACNPPLAYAAVNADPSVGLLLPCNVTVEEAGEKASIVRLTDPRSLIGPVTNRELKRVAEDATARMQRVRETLAKVA